MNLTKFPKRLLLYIVPLSTIFTISIVTSCETKNSNENNLQDLDASHGATNNPIITTPAPKFDFNDKDLVKFIDDFIASGGKTIEEIKIALIKEAQKKNPAISKEQISKELMKIIEAEQANIVNADEILEELDPEANPGHYCKTGGLNNVGNTCFMNATLQAVIHFGRILDPNIPLPKYKNKQKKEQYTTLEKEQMQRIKEAYARISNNLTNNNPVKNEDLESIRSDIRNLWPKAFPGYAQADAGELLLHLLSIMGTKNIIINNKTTIKCETCNKIGPNPTIDEFNTLDIDLQKGNNSSMEDLIKKHFSEKTEIEWYCPNCKANKKAIKTMSITNTPATFIVSAKRFIVDYAPAEPIKEKISDPIKQVEAITLDINGKKVNYKLKSVITHSGTLDYGHYWSNSLDPSNKWQNYDDSNLSPLANTKNLEDGYIFIYEKAK